MERCKGRVVYTGPGPFGDVPFYAGEAKFDALKDDAEQMYFKRLPKLITSMKKGDIVAKVLISARRSNGVTQFLIRRRDMHD